MQRREFIAAVGAAAASAVSQSGAIYAQPIGGVAHRSVQANGINLHFAEQGEGPLVVLCHGFPELWYSWRYQVPALSAAGFHAVAPDMRGYGRSDRPLSASLSHAGRTAGVGLAGKRYQ
jgi:predicted alpha/beta-fold hydrolase